MNTENFKIKERRQQVATLLSKSFNDKEIAQQLGISQPTVCRDIKVLKEMSQQFVFDLAKSEAKDCRIHFQYNKTKVK